MDVVVEMLTGCGVVVVVVAVSMGASMGVKVVVVVVAVMAAATRIQHRTPRLRPRAPSTPLEHVIPGFVIY